MTKSKNIKNKRNFDNIKDKLTIEPIFKPNILADTLKENKKNWIFWVVIFLFMYFLSYTNGIIAIIFCYMWWYYLIPDILDIVCYYLSIKRNNQLHCILHHTSKKEGLVSYICNVNLNNYTNKSKIILKQYGNIPIKSLTIYRNPVCNSIESILNILTFGKWFFIKKKYSIETFFHTSLIANIGEKNIVIEKNEMINISTDYEKYKNEDTEIINVENINVENINVEKLTINKMLQNTRKKLKNTKYFSYDAFENNCQTYIKHILQCNNLYSDTINIFLYQDTTLLLSDFPYYARKIINFSTNTFAIICDVIQKI